MSSETADGAMSDDGASTPAGAAPEKEKTQEKKPYNKPGPKPKRKRGAPTSSSTSNGDAPKQSAAKRHLPMKEPLTNPRLQLNKYLKVVDSLYSITKGDAETIKTAKDALSVKPLEGAAGISGLHRHSTLGMLLSSVKRVNPMETWSPHEVAIFEAGLCVHGKDFFKIQKLIPSKNTKHVVEFYYLWKKSHHYPLWKARYSQAM